MQIDDKKLNVSKATVEARNLLKTLHLKMYAILLCNLHNLGNYEVMFIIS